MITLFRAGFFDAVPGIYKPRHLYKVSIAGYCAYQAGWKFGSLFN